MFRNDTTRTTNTVKRAQKMFLLHSDAVGSDFDVRLLYSASELKRCIIVKSNFDESTANTDIFAEVVIRQSGKVNISFNEQLGLDKRKDFRQEFNALYQEYCNLSDGNRMFSISFSKGLEKTTTRTNDELYSWGKLYA